MKAEDVIGIVGTILFILAFWRTSVKKWSGKSIVYELDIFLAAACMSYYAFYKHAYLAIVVNFVWIFVSFRGILSYAERRLGRNAKRR